VAITDVNELQKRLEDLRREYRGARSLIEMMEKGTPREELQKIRAEKMKPLEAEIKRLEGELGDGCTAVRGI
jgi:phage host-nuclease inhibitor protein Gam